MQRRRFLELTALSATAATGAALAGCTGTGSGGTGGDSETTTTTATTTTTMNDDTTTDDTDDPLPCPNVRDVSFHVCPGDDGGPFSVDRSAREMPADGGTITVTVTNTGDEKLGLNPYAWAVHRLNDDGHWERVDDRAHIEPWQELTSGESIRWHIASDADYKATDGAIGCSLDLEPDTYGWSVELKPGSKDERVAAAAGFYVR